MKVAHFFSTIFAHYWILSSQNICNFVTITASSLTMKFLTVQVEKLECWVSTSCLVETVRRRSKSHSKKVAISHYAHALHCPFHLMYSISLVKTISKEIDFAAALLSPHSQDFLTLTDRFSKTDFAHFFLMKWWHEMLCKALIQHCQGELVLQHQALWDTMCAKE
jgi:hypothetical protein